MTAALRTSYDEFPYQSVPLRQTHPDHLATVASLFGFDAADVGRARVLEIGCGSGGNLIPLAASYPDSTFVGIDLSAVQIAHGAAEIEALGLLNIRLQAMDVMAFDEAQGAFDYIIAHGIYSWVPAPVQDRILALCASLLAANGIAFVSYNTLPGWRMLSTVREAMLYHTRDVEDSRGAGREGPRHARLPGRSRAGPGLGLRPAAAPGCRAHPAKAGLLRAARIPGGDERGGVFRAIRRACRRAGPALSRR